MRSRLAGRASVAVSAASRRLGLGGGSVIGGRVGLVLEPDLLATLAVGRRIALVSGTNGKTTTTRLLATALGGPSQVATSSAGANLPPGLVSALAASTPGEPAVLEVDEGYLGAVADAVRPQVVALLNLSRDQLDRVSEVRMVAERWRGALARSDATVVANADDPLVVWGASSASRAVWVSAGQLWRQDSVGCPSCSGRIVFARAGGHGGAPSAGPAADAGEWSCACGFRRPVPDATLRDDVLETRDGRRLPIRLALPGRCNRANAAIAAVAAGVLGVDEADALGAMATLAEVEGRFASVEAGGVRVRLLLAKNPAGWAELLDMLADTDDPVVVGINAQVADGHDPSWLWDVEFERLAGRLVVATGERCLDLAVRLRHAGVVHTAVRDELEALAAPGARAVEFVGNYTAFQVVRRRLARGAAPPRGISPTPGAATPSVSSVPSAPKPRSRAAGESALRVVVVHPDLLGTYGDGGNGVVLAGRAAWRGLAVELVHADSDDPLPSGADIYCLGGGEDGPQVQSAERLRDGSLARAVDAGAVVFAVCAGYQVLGHSFPGADGALHAGVGLLDIHSVKGTTRRAVGELLAAPIRPVGAHAEEPDPVALDTLTGFENHGAVTRLGSGVRPFARVLSGVGNGSGGGDEGARVGRVLGSYLHGPALARNPALADLLLAWATGSIPTALDDVEELALRAERLAAVSGRGGGPDSGWPSVARARAAGLLRLRRS